MTRAMRCDGCFIITPSSFTLFHVFASLARSDQSFGLPGILPESHQLQSTQSHTGIFVTALMGSEHVLTFVFQLKVISTYLVIYQVLGDSSTVQQLLK
jgi:hypothetical protein